MGGEGELSSTSIKSSALRGVLEEGVSSGTSVSTESRRRCAPCGVLNVKELALLVLLLP